VGAGSVTPREENGAWPDRRAASGRHNPSAVATGGRRGMSGQGTTGEQGWRAWATHGEHGPAEEEGKWAGPERKQCWFKKIFKWFEQIQSKDGVPEFKKIQIKCGCEGN
jgi:hypothetical protein